MPLDPAFVADSPYGEGGLLLDEIVEIDRAASRIVGRMPTHEALPLTREQRVHPLRHPRHVSGGLMVHMTGMIALAHTYFVLGLKHADGWIGYGGRIHKAHFRALAPPGEPLLLSCQTTQLRKTDKSVLARYDFHFTQGGKVIYEGDQTALWSRVVEAGVAADSQAAAP